MTARASTQRSMMVGAIVAGAGGASRTAAIARGLMFLVEI